MARSLWDGTNAIADRRGRKRRQLPLLGTPAIANAAMLAGANDLRTIFRWSHRLVAAALALFGLEHAPCHATYHQDIFHQSGYPFGDKKMRQTKAGTLSSILNQVDSAVCFQVTRR